jgi:hypothetical protein
LGETSEKGCTRKTTGNRVTSWKELFLGESMVLRCFTKRNGMGGFGQESTWRRKEGGGALMCFKEFIVLGSWGFCERLMIS